MWEVLEAKIDEDCRRQDAERRAQAHPAAASQ
jgi:hypothetical protein